METKHFGRFQSILDVPSLTDIQTKSYEDFLQVDVPFNRRLDHGLESILRETFPILSYDKTMSLQYLETLKSLAASNSTTWILPMEISELSRPIGDAMRAARITRESSSGNEGASGGEEQPITG